MNARLQFVEIVVPVFDEENALESNVELLLGYLRRIPVRVRCRDRGQRLDLGSLRVERKGRGLALKTAWMSSRAQCGFKALRRDAADVLLPHVLDDGWFFDTELLLLAERSGMRIHEVPVDWIEDLDSRVDLPTTIRGDLAGLWRMRRPFLR